MMYYLVPEFIRRRCKALRRISMEHQLLDAKYRKQRLKICKNCTDNGPPFDSNPMETINKKVDDLKILTGDISGNKFTGINQAAITLNTSSYAIFSNTIKQMLSRCENKCHEVLTQLANIDFILNDCEESLDHYRTEMEDSMFRYNLELTQLYKRRLSILTGEHEPSDDEIVLLSESEEARENIHNYLQGCNSSFPDVLMDSKNSEEHNEKIYTTHYSQEAVSLMRKHLTGIPEFWLQSLSFALSHFDIIQPADRIILSYLSDIRYYYNIESISLDPKSSSSSALNSNHRSQLLLFMFDKNPYFSDRTLTKKICIDKCRIEPGCEMHDGLWVTKRKGCKINWYEGRNVTERVMLDHDNSEEPCSFFQFFTDEGFGQKMIRSDGQNLRELDYEVFVHFREFIVPYAVVAYSRGNL